MGSLESRISRERRMNVAEQLVAQLVVAMGFIVFLVYPALTGIIGSV